MKEIPEDTLDDKSDRSADKAGHSPTPTKASTTATTNRTSKAHKEDPSTKADRDTKAKKDGDQQQGRKVRHTC